MLKRGITRVQDIGSRTALLGRERHVSFLLLPELAVAGSDDRTYDEIVARVQLPNGTWKQTASGRLRAVDDVLVRYLRETRPSGSPLSVLDVGASTGVTSVELFDALAGVGFEVEFVATDLYRDAYAVGPSSGRWAVVLDASGEVLQYVVGSFVLPGQLDDSSAYPVNRALKGWSRRRLALRARTSLSQIDARVLPDFEAVPAGDLVVRRLPLISGRCLELMRRGARFRFDVGDVLKPLPDRADVVRAMNIVTRDNFSEEQAVLAIGHCMDAVTPGGLLVLGQSRGLDPAAARATLYQVREGVPVVVERVQGGYELEQLVPVKRGNGPARGRAYGT